MKQYQTIENTKQKSKNCCQCNCCEEDRVIQNKGKAFCVMGENDSAWKKQKDAERRDRIAAAKERKWNDKKHEHVGQNANEQYEQMRQDAGKER